MFKSPGQGAKLLDLFFQGVNSAMEEFFSIGLRCESISLAGCRAISVPSWLISLARYGPVPLTRCRAISLRSRSLSLSCCRPISVPSWLVPLPCCRPISVTSWLVSLARYGPVPFTRCWPVPLTRCRSVRLIKSGCFGLVLGIDVNDHNSNDCQAGEELNHGHAFHVAASRESETEQILYCNTRENIQESFF